MSCIELPNSRLQRLISLILRGGVIAAALTGVLGGMIFLLSHGRQPVSFKTFHDAQPQFASPRVIVQNALALQAGNEDGRGQAIAQLGILVLLFTPVIRVAFSILGFALERDRAYVVITAIVLMTLGWSLSLR
jgi:uncharacterized membrane protein